RELAGGVQFRHVRLSFGPQEKLGFEVALFIPAGSGPFATIVHPGFAPTPGSATLPSTNPARSGDPAVAVSRFEQARSRGYAVATFFYQQCGVDKPDYRGSVFFSAYRAYDWEELGAVGW